MLFLVIAIIAFIVAVIALIVYIVQMHRTKDKYLNKDAMDEIARQAAEKARRKDTILTCDYCGSKIDTKIHKVCPQCGASYGKDKEWLNRYNVDQAKMDQHIEDGLNRNKAKVKDLNALRMRRVLILLTCIVSAIVFVVMIVIIAVTSMRLEATRSDEIPDDYVKTDYAFKDPLIYEDDSVKIELGDIYRREDTFYDEKRYDYDIEVKVTNKTGSDCKFDLDAAAANNKCLYAYAYGDIIAGGSIMKLMNIRNYYLGDEYLKTLAFERISFRDEYNYSYFSEDTIRTMETTADFTPEEKKPEGEVLLSKNGLVFTVFPDPEKPEESAYLQITNTGSFDYKIRTYASLVNGKPDKLWIDGTVPIGCQDETDYLYKVNLEPDEKLEEVLIQFECQCTAHPEQNFVTEYLELPVEYTSAIASASN